MTHLLALLLAKIANERLKIPTSFLVNLQTSVRGQNGVQFDQESNEQGPRHVTHLLSLSLAEKANERLKILTSLLVDLQLSVRGPNRVEFDQESNEPGPRHVTHLFSLLLAEIANKRLKILTSRQVLGVKRARILPGIHMPSFFLAFLFAKIANDSD